MRPPVARRANRGLPAPGSGRPLPSPPRSGRRRGRRRPSRRCRNPFARRAGRRRRVLRVLELERVHEDRSDHEPPFLARATHQRDVAIVERPHLVGTNPSARPRSRARLQASRTPDAVLVTSTARALPRRGRGPPPRAARSGRRSRARRRSTRCMPGSLAALRSRAPADVARRFLDLLGHRRNRQRRVRVPIPLEVLQRRALKRREPEPSTSPGTRRAFER